MGGAGSVRLGGRTAGARGRQGAGDGGGVRGTGGVGAGLLLPIPGGRVVPGAMGCLPTAGKPTDPGGGRFRNLQFSLSPPKS